MKNVMSIDVEFWFDRTNYREHIEINELNYTKLKNQVECIIDLFKFYDQTTTFFILGNIVEYDPEIIKIIEENGHEVGYHGYSHDLLYEIEEPRLSDNLLFGLNLLDNATKSRIRGFRAPTFSLKPSMGNILEKLSSRGIYYDSSVYPVKTPMYGMLNAPSRIYSPSFADISKIDVHQTDLLEFPILTKNFFGVNLPAGGGYFFRLLGSKFTYSTILRNNAQGDPAMCYFHPWELFKYDAPKSNSIKNRIMNHGIPAFEGFKKLISKIECTSAIELIEDVL